MLMRTANAIAPQAHSVHAKICIPSNSLSTQSAPFQDVVTVYENFVVAVNHYIFDN